ncbi:SDR family oxidoreductase [Litorimonas sp. RW-G-Af-16]|uniref:SDR family oxidoreductase n=1 Tax=Litorimonas sp. RW-G-Af-16 TaxID=3241168 RepID=UPI00390CAB70
MFKNKNVVVTGASGGIGKAIAEMFIQNGATVAISDLSSPDATAREIGAIAFACDVSKEADVIAFLEAAEEAMGPVDVFVANAGVGFGDPKHAAGASNDDWELSWQVNVMGAVYGARALLPKMQARGEGRIVITASAAGLLSQIGSSSYTATKHAAVGLAESIAIRHWDQGIRTHCICPQYVRTNMTKGMAMAEGHQDGLLEPADVADALKIAIEEERFLVLSHPIVGEYFKQKAMDYEGYISGMNKLKQKLGAEQLPNSKPK